jgi:outer membrane protein OmpA-like peptidoglycan-associated protein
LGLISKLESINSLYTLDIERFFTVLSPGIYAASDIRFDKITFSPRIEIYQAYLQQESADNLQFNNGYSVVNASANLRSKNMGLYALFKYGPSSIFEHFIYSSTGELIKWFFLMPYYKKLFFNKSVLLDMRGNYINDLNNNERTFNINTQLFWYLPKDLTVRFQNTIYSRSRIDLNTNIKYSYSNMYFELGIRKEFNCKQPRVQYHDLKIIFYRDINGDRIKNKNEPGISNVLAVIVSDFNTNTEKISNFNEVQFLSNETGSVEYKNIQNGFFIIKYQLLNEIVGNFTLEQLEYSFEMDNDKVIYIPYHENNKIIGKVVLNRDPLSSLGPLDISNIRVIAEDTKGHSYSALTDKQGNFTLYTPVADHYIVKINNIFYESFDLQQPEFIVKFNGYKQFEVTFVFNEKKKKISFDNELDVEDIDLEDIKVIRKTTLTGKIRDAISLEPVEAEIKIIDNRTNKVISRTISNKLNGNYNISYAAGVHFRIEVISRDHWEHVENLYIEQVISIQNINKDIMLNKLSESRDEQKTFIIYDKEDEFKENFKRGQRIPINYLTFELKKTRLDPKAKPELDRLIDLLNKNKSVKIEIAGHADDKGNARVENIMAKRRAEAVKKYLTMHGLSGDRIEVKSYSNTRPLIPGTSEKARSKNRRVEIIVQ